VLEGLRQTGPGENVSQSMWQQAQTFRVKRADPISGSGGKFWPLVRHGVVHSTVTERRKGGET
jgi:hypothetical protein